MKRVIAHPAARFRGWRAWPLAVLLAATSLPAMAARDYDGCSGFIDSLPATISTAGTWCLRKDLNGALASGDAIKVTGSNVTIDCNEFKLGNLAAGSANQANGIRADGINGLTVRHCNIRGFRIGLNVTGDMDNHGGHLVERNRFDAILLLAVRVVGYGSTIRDNLIVGVGGSSVSPDYVFATGIETTGNVDILDNIVDGLHPTDDWTLVNNTYSTGISAYDGNAVVARNRISGLSAMGISGQANGISIEGFSHVPIVLDNVITGGGTTDIECGGGRARGNTSVGFERHWSGCTNDGGNVMQ